MQTRIGDLSGLRVLIAEDEPLIAMMLEEMLADLGCEIAGSFSTVNETLIACESTQFDVALIDMNLGGERADPIIDVLTTQNTPHALATGGEDMAADAGAKLYLRKPFGENQLRDMMLALQTQL